MEQLLEQLFSVDRVTLTAVALVGFAIYKVYYYYSTYVDVDTVGVPPGILGPWIASFQNFTQGNSLIREGYKRYRKDGRFFKIATIARYLVIPTDPKLLVEMRDAPDDVLSFSAASSERFSIDYTLDRNLLVEKYHLKVIQSSLTQRLSTILPEVVSELALAWEDNTNIGDEWSEVNIWDVMLKVIPRTVNRMFVGLPLCRNQDYLDNLVEYSTQVSKSAIILDMTPRIFRRPLSWYILNKPKRLRNLMKFVGPVIEERKKNMRELGDKWTDRPDDAIQWFLDSAPRGVDTENEQLAIRILLFNFAAIHTTTISITHALYDLATHQELHMPLKDEISNILAEDGGWTKQGLTKMKKLDSALKESLRLNSIASISMQRKAMVPYTFSDGTFIPKGTILCAPSAGIHSECENPFEYDGFRFERLRKEAGQATKHQMVSTNMDYLAFGHGKHSCPGRFFVANELKILLANIITNYEFKTQTGERPKNTDFCFACIPDRSAKLLFRKRSVL